MVSTFTTVENELKSLIKGDCFFDEVTREKYSTAASWYKIRPVCVVFPRDIEDVQAVVRLCDENEIPLIARGAGTGLAGQAIGMGIILDFTKHMNQIIDAADDAARVQPGAVVETLNEKLRPQDKFFPIDPASGNLCTIGGMIATNAAGAHGIKYGSMKDHVESMTVVLANGDLASIKQTYSNTELERQAHFENIFTSTRSLLMNHRNLIVQRFPKVAKNSSGYNLLGAVKTRSFDIRKIIIGSEGTLAVVVEAELSLSILSRSRIGAIAFFADYESTVDATLNALEQGPSAIEILDHTYLMHGQKLDGNYKEFIRLDAKAMLYFEFEGDSLAELEKSIVRLKTALASCRPLEFRVLKTKNERERFWKLREDVAHYLNLVKSSGKTSFIEDVTVPLANLPAYMKNLEKILSKYKIEFSAYGHAGSGNIHCAAFVNLKDPDTYRIIDQVASEVSELAISLGGTLSGEHGDGFVRTPFLERLYGSEVYHLFEEVKQTFDPKNILNPGKIVGKQNTSILHDISLE